MTPTTSNRLRRFVGYPVFFSFAFTAMLYLTFPYRMVADRISAEAKKSNLDVTMDSLGPSLFGVRAKKLAVMPPKQEGQSADRLPIVVDELVARPALLPPGVSFSAKVFGGTMEGSFDALSKRPRLVVRAKGLDLSKSNAKPAVGLDLAGRLNVVVDLELDNQDNSKTTGRVAMTADELAINGGTVAQYDLPKVDLGHLETELKFGEGRATVQTFKTNGTDVESAMEGDIALAQRMLFSTLRLKVKFKPAEDFLRRNSFIQTGLNFAMTKDAKGFYSVNLDRMLGNPHFQPVR